MSAKIIHLSEYLEQYRHNIVKSVAHALGMDPENQLDLKKVDDMMVYAAERKFGSMVELETNLIAAVEAHDDKAVKDLLDVQEFNTETFNGIDIAEGFNFRCQVENEVARSSVMDWLEEGGLDYLIDNEGRFAVKCPTRKVEYKVTRAFEHMTNKWDRGPVRKAVDPDTVKKGLTDIKRFGLSNDIDEIAASQPSVSPGTGKGVETGLGPSIFPADKKEKTRHFSDEELENMVNEEKPRYQDNEDSVRQLMTDFNPPLSDNTEILPDPSTANVWLAIDHGNQLAWIVYLADEDAEDVDYDEAVSKYSRRNPVTGREHFESAKNLTEAKGKKKRKTAKQRERDAKEKLDQMGPVGSGTAEQIMKDFGLTGTDADRMDKEKKHKEKKEQRKKVDVDEATKIDENILGMLGMQNIGRMKELAGMPTPDDTTITVTAEPITQETPSCEEYTGLDLAMNKLEDVFKVYSVLPCEEKAEFRKRLIDYLMKDD